tara:strand:+ start:200 stop:484 length:285 start_codon:yes stop_codon:yes gene_type:complete
MRGGKRPGAGRPRGVTAGTKGKRLEEHLESISRTPLDYMINVLNNPATSPERKMWAAEKAAPYLHPRLASKELKVSGDENKPVKINLCQSPEKE